MDPSLGSLADDVVDIHQDVVGGLAEYEMGRISAALWAWKFSFQHHWGPTPSGPFARCTAGWRRMAGIRGGDRRPVVGLRRFRRGG